MAANPHLSVLIITFNDDKIIESTLKVVTNHLKNKTYPYEVIVTDGSSNLKSRETIKNIVEKIGKDNPHIRYIFNPHNSGKGSLVKYGMQHSNGDFKLFMDHDNATNFEQIDNLLEKVDQYDIVIASRYIKGAQIIPQRSFFRNFVSRGGNIVINFILRLPQKDTRCGFKLFNKKAVEAIFSRIKLNSFGFDDEVLVLARKLNFKVTEVPVEWHDIEEEQGLESHVKLKDVLMSFVEMAQIRWNLLTKKYNL